MNAPTANGNPPFVYRDPPPPDPAPGEVGTGNQQIRAVFLSLDMAVAEDTTTTTTWPAAYRITMQREWVEPIDPETDAALKWEASKQASVKRLNRLLDEIAATAWEDRDA